MKTVARFDEPTSAHVARAFLESEGIPAFVADEYVVGAYWLYANAVEGVKVQVADEYADRARALLIEDRSDAVAMDETPLRASSRRGRLSWALILGVALWVFFLTVSR